MFKNIILATDFSSHAVTARNAAISMAKAEKAELTVLYVYDIHQKMLDEGVLMASEIVETAEKKRFELEAIDNLAEYCAPIEEKGIQFSPQIRHGKAADTIIGAAKELGADLIIIGSHSKRGFLDISLGSVAAKVGERAPCPVLIVTHYDKDAQTEEAAPVEENQ